MTAAAPPPWVAAARPPAGYAPAAAQVTTGAQPAALAGRPWWLMASIGVGALVVLAIAVVVAVVLPRPEGGGSPAASGTASAAGTGVPSSQDTGCERACAKLQACGVPLDAGCAAGCAVLTPVQECLARLSRGGHEGDCEEVAACFVGGTCPIGPSGRASCRASAQCEADCSTRKINEVDCLCGCISRLDPAKSLELLTNNACALVRCPKECNPQTPFSVCADCFARHCAREGQLCSSN